MVSEISTSFFFFYFSNSHLFLVFITIFFFNNTNSNLFNKETPQIQTSSWTRGFIVGGAFSA